MRVGMGYDAHRFDPERPLILGGVAIPYNQGLMGHSDADVLVHAIMDALLGAAALGDIGLHFPDTDPAYRNVSSIKLLRRVVALLQEHNYSLVNLDAVIIAQKPRLAPYIHDMKEEISRALKVPPGSVNIKATTTEGMGFTGREEGIAAAAVALIESLSPR